MRSLILNCDFIGYKPNLFIQEDSIYRSKFTGLLSILIAILSIASASYFGSELIIKSTPIVIETTSNFDDFGPYVVSNKGLFFMLGMEYQDGVYYTDNTLFEVSAQNLIVRNIRDENTGKWDLDFKVKKLEIDVCSKFYNQSDILENNLILPLSTLYCLKPNQAEVQGYWGTSGIYSNIKVSFTKCKNTTENNNHCKSKEIIDKTIQSGYISVDYTIFEPNLKNVSYPFNRVFYDNYNLLNANASLQYVVELKSQILKSDHGLIFQDENIFDGFTHQLMIFNSLTRDDNIFSIEFHGSHSGKIFLRSYIKLQTVLTQIGGFVKFIMLLGSLFSSMISKNLFFINFLSENNIFELKKEKEINYSSTIRQDSQKITTLKKTNFLHLHKNSRIGENKNKLNKSEYQNENEDPGKGSIPDYLNFNIPDQSRIDNTLVALDKNKSNHQLPNLNNKIENSRIKKYDRGNNKQFDTVKSITLNKRSSLDSNLKLKTSSSNKIVSLLFVYICAVITPCRKINKSEEIYLLNRMEKIFKKSLSLDVILRKLVEVELMKDIVIDKNIELKKQFSLCVYNTIMKSEEELENLSSSNIFIIK